MMSRSQPGWCRRRRAAVADNDDTPTKGYTSRAERSAGFTKTRLCKFFLEGACTRGKKCTFAHGEEDKLSQSQPLCMKLCKTLIATGRCKNANCRYAHSKEDIVAAKQLAAGLVDSQEAHVGSVVPDQFGGPVQLNGNLAHNNVRWFGFMRWVCPLRAQQRVGLVPPGVLEPSSAVSYPMMQMTTSEVPTAHQLEENNSLLVSSESAFQVVVKNTFIDIVEKSPKSASRSRSEPPQFMKRDVEKRPRSQSASEDMSVSSTEQEIPEVNCVEEAMFAPAAEMVEPSEVAPCALECPVPPSSALDLAPPLDLSQERQSKQEDGVEEYVAVAKIQTWESSSDFPVLEVRNTFIEVCQDSSKIGALRPVKSADGRLDLLACEESATHQEQS